METSCRRILGLAVLGLGLGAACLASCRAGVTRGEVLLADGLERLALGDSAGALALLEEADYSMPNNARVLFHLGRLQAVATSFEARARAEKALRQAVALAPRNGAYHEALGDVLRRQGFQRLSTQELRAAVRLDPKLGRAWYLLGLNLQRDCQEAPEARLLLDSTVACYERALAADPGNDEARYRLAFLCLRRDELERARLLVQPLVAGRDCPGRFGLLLAAIDCRARRFEVAQEILERVLPCLSPVERESWIGLQHVLPPDSAYAYRLRHEAKRDSMAAAFWWRRDPTPTTLVNERLVEHVARGVESDLLFEVQLRRRSGRDTDRGDIYVRYGAPPVAERSFDYEFPAWCWTYRDAAGKERRIEFLDRTLSGNYMRVRRRAIADFSTKEMIDAEPETSSLRFPGPGSDWRYVLRQFRGEAGRTAIEVAYEVGIDSSLADLDFEVAAWRAPGRLAARTHTGTPQASLFRVANGRSVGRLRLEVQPELLEIGLQMMGMHCMPHPSPAGETRPEVAWIAFGRDTLGVESFDPARLTLSDLVLAHEVRAGDGGLFDMGGGIAAVPKVDGRIAGGTLHLYFEIYPSTEILQGRRSLAVTYRVQTAPARWSFWQQFRPDFELRRDPREQPAVQETFTFPPSEPIERQQLSIDARNLPPGDYALTVEVGDAAGGGEPASRTIPFTIPGARPVDN